ncbi:MAG: hypothetical protein IH847_02525 [Acidobacteria bacterium]|nr:hypothetical protein [Acidobacteriota bacterium]
MTEQVVDICLCEMSPATKIAGVPAFVCDRCDERIYSSEVSIRLDDIRERFDVLAYDSAEPMYVYQYDPLAPGHAQITFRYGSTRRMTGVTTILAASFVGDANVKTEVLVEAYPGTANVAQARRH